MGMLKRLLISLPALLCVVTTQSQARPGAIAAGGGPPCILTEEKYTYDFDGTTIDHTITTQVATLGNYKLQEKIIDGVGLIHYSLSLADQTLLTNTLPNWKGLSEASFVIVDPLTNKTCSLSPVARDINGDGNPDLIVGTDTGAARGATQYSFYTLDGKSATQWYNGTLLSPQFTDTDGDGVFDIAVDDDIFEGWLGSTTYESPFPKVNLSWSDSAFTPKPVPPAGPLSKVEFDKEIFLLEAEIKKAGRSKPGEKFIVPSVWKKMVDLTYRGRTNQAKILLMRLYPGSLKLRISTMATEAPMTREVFWQKFLTQLAKGRLLRPS